MKTSQILSALICLLLVLTVAGCTDSKTTTKLTATHEKTPIAEQPSLVHNIKQPNPSSADTQKTPSTSNNKKIPAAGGNLTVHFIDVGQGDSILLEHGDDTMLIDSGEIGKGDDVATFVKSEGIKSLDYVVATHPHSDHIGGMSVILNDFPIMHFVDSGYAYSSKTYENMLTTIDKKNIPFVTPKRGDKINFSSGIDVQVLNPGKSYFTDDINQNSVVLKVTDGKVVFLLMGDAGIEAENEIMKDGYDVNADILKVGHHGSRTSSGASFISAVSPSVSVIEVGGNDYGHPHQETLNRLQKVSKVYRTDSDGTIMVTTDGSTYTVTTQKTETTGGSRSTSSGSAVYSSTSSTKTQEIEPAESMTSSSTGSVVYVSDLSLKDEWVKITNKGSSSVSLAGWKVEDKGGKHIYTFPSYTLNYGSTVTLYTGKGKDTATELYWQLNDPVWNNNGDTAYLLDNSGKLVSELERGK
jgi:beta-lactamase superfamily II metal-dependent hydrolase